MNVQNNWSLIHPIIIIIFFFFFLFFFFFSDSLTFNHAPQKI